MRGKHFFTSLTKLSYNLQNEPANHSIMSFKKPMHSSWLWLASPSSSSIVEMMLAISSTLMLPLASTSYILNRRGNQHEQMIKLAFSFKCHLKHKLKVMFPSNSRQICLYPFLVQLYYSFLRLFHEIQWPVETALQKHFLTTYYFESDIFSKLRQFWLYPLKVQLCYMLFWWNPMNSGTEVEITFTTMS